MRRHWSPGPFSFGALGPIYIVPFFPITVSPYTQTLKQNVLKCENRLTFIFTLDNELHPTCLGTLTGLAVKKVGNGRSTNTQVFHAPLWDLRLPPQVRLSQMQVHKSIKDLFQLSNSRTQDKWIWGGQEELCSIYYKCSVSIGWIMYFRPYSSFYAYCHRRLSPKEQAFLGKETVSPASEKKPPLTVRGAA